MKNINILSLIQAHGSLKEKSFESFLQHYGIEIKSDELQDLNVFISNLNNDKNNISIFDGFYVGYKIPQISKEFDLLRFGNDCVINIELKKKSSEEKILKQLVRNKYYLGYIGIQIYNLTFVSDTEELYFLNNKDALEKVNVSFLEELLRNQVCDGTEILDDLFNPSNYLVSPFNSTQKFIDNKYFLTNQQEEVKTKIIKSLSSVKIANFISVIGGAGTGKTLLIYDIVKSLREMTRKPLLFHCGSLNEGHKKLKKLGWEILPIKGYKQYDLSKYDAIFIDEAQRIYTNQLEDIVAKIKSSSGNCVFSYDGLQTLSKWEQNNDIDGKINNINHISVHKLSEKIRTNKEIAAFIKMLFNKKRKLPLSNKGNVELNYYKNIEDAKRYLGSLESDDWEVLRFTPSQYNDEYHEKYSSLRHFSSHKVIGQEFDKIALTIDKNFAYDANGKLDYFGKSYYDPVKMLFQNITRTRKQLNLVIIDNEELLNRCLSILKS